MSEAQTFRWPTISNLKERWCMLRAVSISASRKPTYLKTKQKTSKLHLRKGKGKLGIRAL